MTVGSQTIIEGRNIDITDAIREYAESKLSRIHKHFDSLIQNHDIHVVLSVLKKNRDNNQKAEITINLKGGHIIRCQSSEANVYASIDTVVDKIEGQLRKYKTKIYSKIHHGKSVKEYGLEEMAETLLPDDFSSHVESYKEPEIIKVKRFKMKALEPEQAVEMLDDCGHSFYMFLNIFSNRIAAVYKREDGGFGLIEPEFLQVDN
ncbi:MAG: ribosome-associated translation inhibitor RaiA [Candidatus Melainabacteria bacterium]|nr:ribosome-associated translation inhibitor RaiA [Candidatus Melainabacteria bacterium]